MPGPLHGVRVIDLTTTVLGPFASQILGDMGAEVWKVEPPAGDPLRGVGPKRSPRLGAYFHQLNRNKRSVVLDLKTPAGAAALRRMLPHADVLLYANRPSAMARLGLSYEVVAAINPRIVYCGAYGYGQGGPYADRPAYDDLIQGASSLAALQAGADGAPRYAAVTLADRIVGMATASAIGMALYHRERTGAGQAIGIPMFETMAEFVMGDHLYGFSYEPPLGPMRYPRVLERRPYRTKDGYISCLPYTDAHWRAFFRASAHPELLDDPRFASVASRNDAIADVYDTLESILRERTSAEWLAALIEADVPVAPVHTPETLFDDPHLRAVGQFRTFEHETEGTIRLLDIPSRWSASQPEIVRGAPRLGRHTAEVLRACGCSEDEIAAVLAAAAGAPHA